MGDSTFLFIADISGFTRFVTTRSPDEGVRMAEEMLRIIVRSNKLGLKLCEIEGDAVFFYSNDRQLTFEKLSSQVRQTFSEFQDYLFRHDLGNELGIKFIAHAGHCPRIKVKGKSKLFGQEVIRLHRLLKNRKEDMNYFLVTEAASKFLDDVPSGENGNGSFEHLGTVQYTVFGQSFLWSQQIRGQQSLVARLVTNANYFFAFLGGGLLLPAQR